MGVIPELGVGSADFVDDGVAVQESDELHSPGPALPELQ
jgi:hypothetical protein